MMNLDPWRSSCVIEVVEEAHEASCLMKKPLKNSLEIGPTNGELMVLVPLKEMMWSFVG